MTETYQKRSFKPLNVVGWVWLAFGVFGLILTSYIAISTVTTNPINLGAFFYSLTYILYSLLHFVFYKIFHLKQDSLATYTLALVIGLLMGICMFLSEKV